MPNDTPTNRAKGKGPRETDAEPEITPRGRDDTARADRPRRQGDAPHDPARPSVDTQRREHDAGDLHEVRAGPGDAGAQDAPEVLPKAPQTPKASFARIALWFAVPIAVLLALYWASTL